jgi:pimeloyl-ACP methyl ester carboxylesterase
MTARLALACVLLATATPAWPQTADWRDASPHKATQVEVEEGVTLEVLDWGGSGRALVLLAGLGDSLHVFDDVAPTLAMRYRVIGISRRGHPGSSSPMTGYTLPRLAEDIVRVMDALGLKTAVVVGHSFAGEEMHVLAARYTNRVSALIYVDAAFDRADRFEAHEAASRAMPAPPRPQPADSASFAALREYLTRLGNPVGPEARLRTRYVANADGTVRAWSPEPHVMQAYQGEMRALTKAYKPERIRVPALPLYAVPASPDDLMRTWYPADDPAIRQKVDALYPLERENVQRHARWFAAFAGSSGLDGKFVKSSEVRGSHDLFVSSPREVLGEIDAFVKLLP